MSLVRLILASLLHHRRVQAAVALGVAAGTAVLVGAILVGDSMRESLRRLTLDRLGRIDQALVSDRFFRAHLADETAQVSGLRPPAAAVPVIILRASLESTGGESPQRANQVNLIGCDRRFWGLGSGGPDELPRGAEIVLNRAVADLLQVAEGQTVLVSLPRPGVVPGDSPLGRKTDTVLPAQQVMVRRIIPADGLGRFSLRPNQQEPRNAYVPLDWLQDRLGQPGRANAMLVADDSDSLSLRPRPEDYGIRIASTPRGYINITSDRMVLEPAAEREILRRLREQGAAEVQPALTYLANTIALGKKEIPYSTIAAVDFADRPPLGPMLDTAGKPVAPLEKGEIALNSWAADDLGASPGDTIRVAYFEPESVEGEVRERTAEFRLAAVVRLAGPAADPAFVPDVPGVTDRRSIANWDPPFPFDATRVRPKDDTYWTRRRGTPKAFVSLAEGQRLWGSRFGRLTSIRVAPGPGVTAQTLENGMALDPERMGFVFQPVKKQGLAASAGTTDFEGLFLGFSFFVIASAAMLVAILFGLGIARRASEIGTLLAVGFGRRRIGRMLLAEGLIVAAVGGLLGIAAGVGYAALMIAGLQTLWVEAVVTPFLRLHVTLQSVLIGYGSGLVVAMLAIWWSGRQATRVAPRQLLAGEVSSASRWLGTRRRAAGIAAVVLIAAAVVLGGFAGTLPPQAQMGAFFGTGAIVLAAALAFLWTRLAAGATGPAVSVGGGNLLRLAARNAARHPGRSTLTIGLVAAASFLIVAVSAFQQDVSRDVPDRASGNGGFALVAESDQPIYANVNSPDARAQLGFSKADSQVLDSATVTALRVKPGDDASCLNLYRPQQPRVLGLPQCFIERGGFAWSSSAASSPAERENPWLLLNRRFAPGADGVPRVPVVLEGNTATYSLHLGGVGSTLDITDGQGRPLRLEMVGLLGSSIFQGDLLIGESAFLEHFPQQSGYRFFLVETPPASARPVEQALERDLGFYGLAVETTGRRMARFLQVQNTYLSTFRDLGLLGLLLGTFGLAAVQLRSVLERRGELALLRATGFRRAALAWLVTLENGLLLVAGLAVGLLAAAVAVLPHVFSAEAGLPWVFLAITLALVLASGFLAGLAAVRTALATPLLGALRGD